MCSLKGAKPENFERMVATIIIFFLHIFRVLLGTTKLIIAMQFVFQKYLFNCRKDKDIHFYGRWPQMIKQPCAAIAALSVQLLLPYSLSLLLMHHESDFTSTDAGIKFITKSWSIP